VSDQAAAYDRLLASIGARANDIGDRPIVLHWPHVGSAYRGLVIVGQALYGWPDDFVATQFRTAEGRAEAMRVAQARNADRHEPLDWIATNRVRNSPFWTTARLLAEAIEPTADAPWFGRFAWVNLYPAAPENPPGNPAGPLREAQDSFTSELLRASVDALDAHTVIAFVGPYWWPTGSDSAFAAVAEQPRPLLRAGLIDGRRWIVGWHPGGASRRGFGPSRYAEIIRRAIDDWPTHRAVGAGGFPLGK
jgi:hypothetical protein